MSCVRSLAVALVVLLLAGTGSAAWAQHGRGGGGGPPPQAAGQRAMQGSLSESVRRAARDSRGQVLSAERVPFDGREMHRVKVLDSRGRVRVYMDDPQQSRRERDDRGRSGKPRTRDDDD